MTNKGPIWRTPDAIPKQGFIIAGGQRLDKCVRACLWDNYGEIIMAACVLSQHLEYLASMECWGLPERAQEMLIV